MKKDKKQNNYLAPKLGDTKPRIEIGGKGHSTGDKFIPNLNISWECGTGTEQYFLNINRDSVRVSDEVEAEKKGRIAITIGPESDIFHIDENGRLKWDIDLLEKPQGNVFEWKITYSPKIQFAYQSSPEARYQPGIGGHETLESWLDAHDGMTEEARGSYAIYGDKRNNFKRNGKIVAEYFNGKLGHIYRPLCIDADGKKEWAGLHIETTDTGNPDIHFGKLTITIPQEYLDNATYPVTLDPTIGYDTAASNPYTANYFSAATGNHEAGSSGVADSIFIYCTNGTTPNYKAAIYSGTVGHTNDKTRESDTYEVTSVGSTGWQEIDVSAEECAITSGTSYYVGFRGEWSAVYYDTGISGYTAEYNAETYSNSCPATWNPSSVFTGNPTSSYFTYSAASGDVTITFTNNPSGAQWRCTTGSNTWKNSGETESGLSVGDHDFEYSTVTGYTAPDDETITVANGSNPITRTYVESGDLTITFTTNPSGAQWRVTTGSNTWRNSGATETNLEVGTHSIEYSAVTNYTSPSDHDTTIVQGSNSLTKTYTLSSGSLTIVFSPNNPTGATWRIDAGTWRASGYTETGLTIDDHTVEYSAVANYTKPITETVTIAGGSNSLSRNYIPDAAETGDVVISFSPNNPSGSAWRLNGGAWNSSGATVTGVTVGEVDIEYLSVSGYTAPSNETLTITTGTNSYTRNYAEVSTTNSVVWGKDEGSGGIAWDNSSNGWTLGDDASVDSSFGSLTFDARSNDAWAYTEVIDTARNQNGITIDHTQSSSGYSVWIRGSLTSFSKSATSPSWELYTATITKPWRYVQFKMTYLPA